jgi:hypothetical protein
MVRPEFIVIAVAAVVGVLVFALIGMEGFGGRGSVPIDPNAPEGEPYVRFDRLTGEYINSDNLVIDGLTVNVVDADKPVILRFWIQNAGYEDAKDVHLQADRNVVSWCFNSARNSCYPQPGWESEFTLSAGYSGHVTLEIYGLVWTPVVVRLVDAAGQSVGPDTILVLP